MPDSIIEKLLGRLCSSALSLNLLPLESNLHVSESITVCFVGQSHRILRLFSLLFQSNDIRLAAFSLFLSYASLFTGHVLLTQVWMATRSYQRRRPVSKELDLLTLSCSSHWLIRS